MKLLLQRKPKFFTKPTIYLFVPFFVYKNSLADHNAVAIVFLLCEDGMFFYIFLFTIVI